MYWPVVRHSLSSAARKGEDFSSHDELVWSAPAAADDTPLSIQVFGVFDGHGGKESAGFVKTHLVSEFVRQLNDLAAASKPASSRCHYEEHHMKALQNAFVKVDEQCRSNFKHSGTTATLVLVLQEPIEDNTVIPGNARRAFVTVANVGDSSVYLDNGAAMTRLNEEHRAGQNKSELKRVTESGGSITRDDPKSPYRLFPGGLMMTRTIGDRDAHQAIAEPAIAHIALRVESGGGGGRLILASDGLWDAISAKECGNLTRKTKTATGVSKALLREATKREGRDGDDVTIFVIDISDVPDVPFQRTLHADGTPNRPFYIWRPLHDNAPDYIRHLQAALNEGISQDSCTWFRERETVYDVTDETQKEYKVTVCEGPLTLLQNKGWVPTSRLALASNKVSIDPKTDQATRLAIEAALHEEMNEDPNALERVLSPPWEEPANPVKRRGNKAVTEEKIGEISPKKTNGARANDKKDRKPKKRIAKTKGPRNQNQPQMDEQEAKEPSEDRPEHSHDLFIVGFPDEWTEADVHAYFERYCPVTEFTFKVNPETKERAVFLTFERRNDPALEDRVCGRHIINTSHMYVVKTEDAFGDDDEA